MNTPASIQDWLRVGRYVDRRQFFAWFYGVGLSISIGLVATFAVLDHFFGKPTPEQRLIRTFFVALAFAGQVLIIWTKVFRPAIQRADDDRNRNN